MWRRGFIYLFFIYSWLTANEITVYNKKKLHIFTWINESCQLNIIWSGITAKIHVYSSTDQIYYRWVNLSNRRIDFLSQWVSLLSWRTSFISQCISSLRRQIGLISQWIGLQCLHFGLKVWITLARRIRFLHQFKPAVERSGSIRQFEQAI